MTFETLSDIRKPRPSVVNRSGSIHLIISVNCEYEIEWDRIKTENDLLRWVLHLSEKTWFTTAMAREMIILVSKHRGFSMWKPL